MRTADLLGELIGEHPSIGAVREQVRRLLASEQPDTPLPSILIEGPAGAGKGLLAWLIHRSGVRADRPFVTLDCTDLPPELLDAELFGHAPGCFCCDGQHGRGGLLEEADRGTLFLDGIECLTLVIQHRLERVLRERATLRLGETRERKVDLRFISAARFPMSVEVDQGRFRKTLYDGLAGVTFSLPALLGRGRDVVLLAERLLERACRAAGTPVKRLAPDAEARLLCAPFYVGARELADVMERLTQSTTEPLVTAEMLAAAGWPARPAPPA
jgi:two-component system response regulator PilR (NtrC family)